MMLDIVSRIPNETMSLSLQTFIVRFLIIGNTENRQIYIQTEREKGKLPERQKERVCEKRRVVENRFSVCRKNGHWRDGPFWDNPRLCNNIT